MTHPCAFCGQPAPNSEPYCDSECKDYAINIGGYNGDGASPKEQLLDQGVDAPLCKINGVLDIFNEDFDHQGVVRFDLLCLFEDLDVATIGALANCGEAKIRKSVFCMHSPEILAWIEDTLRAFNLTLTTINSEEKPNG